MSTMYMYIHISIHVCIQFHVTCSLIHSCNDSLLIRMFIHCFSVISTFSWLYSFIRLWGWSTLTMFRVNLPWSHWWQESLEPWPGENHSKERLVHQRLCVEAQFFEDKDDSFFHGKNDLKIDTDQGLPAFSDSGDIPTSDHLQVTLQLT